MASAKLAENESGVAEFVFRLYAGLSATFDQLTAADNAKWQAAFAADWAKFDRLAEQARADIRAGEATPLDLDQALKSGAVRLFRTAFRELPVPVGSNRAQLPIARAAVPATRLPVTGSAHMSITIKLA